MNDNVDRHQQPVRQERDEFLSLNGNAYNQAAKKLLSAIDSEQNPVYLYSLQLAIDGLQMLWDKGELDSERREDLPQAIEQAEVMLGWDPSAVQPWLNRGGTEEDREDPSADQDSADWLNELACDPATAATSAGINLWENLQERLPHLSRPAEPTE